MADRGAQGHGSQGAPELAANLRDTKGVDAAAVQQLLAPPACCATLLYSYSTLLHAVSVSLQASVLAAWLFD